MVVRPPGRERVIQELREIHVHPGIARMKSLAEAVCGGQAWMQAWKPSCESLPSVSQVDPAELVSCPDPLARVRKRVWCSERLGAG